MNPERRTHRTTSSARPQRGQLSKTAKPPQETNSPRWPQRRQRPEIAHPRAGKPWTVRSPRPSPHALTTVPAQGEAHKTHGQPTGDRPQRVQGPSTTGPRHEASRQETANPANSALGPRRPSTRSPTRERRQARAINPTTTHTKPAKARWRSRARRPRVSSDGEPCMPSPSKAWHYGTTLEPH